MPVKNKPNSGQRTTSDSTSMVCLMALLHNRIFRLQKKRQRNYPLDGARSLCNLESKVDFHELARKQLADYDLHRPGSIFANTSLTMTIGQAYELQMEVAQLRIARGEPLAGYKVGCISQTMQAQLGIGQPVFGHLFATEIHRSGVTLDSNRFDGLAIEGEFAVRLAADIPDAAWLRVHPREAIASAFAVIELHNFVFRNSPHTAVELIGNNAIHAGLVVPSRETALESPDELLDAEIAVWKNGSELGTATGRTLPEGPYASLMHLADNLARFGRRLQRGQIVLTGSPLPLYPVTDGDFLAVLSNRSETVTASVSHLRKGTSG